MSERPALLHGGGTPLFFVEKPSGYVLPGTHGQAGRRPRRATKAAALHQLAWLYVCTMYHTALNRTATHQRTASLK